MTEPSNLRDAAEVETALVEKPRPYPHATPGFNCSEYFGFEGGSLTIRTVGDRAGSGWFCFAEQELDWETDDETGKDYRICYLANSELIAIRDKLNEIFPADRAAVEAAVEAATIAKVVAWLHSKDQWGPCRPSFIAHAIEAGEHLK